MTTAHDTPQFPQDHFRGKKLLVLGGLGFVGSNVIARLEGLNAAITVLDSLDPRYGGNPANVAPFKSTLRVVRGDIRDEALMKELVVGQDFIVNLTGQISYIDSGKIPFEDLDVNCRGPLVVLEACRKYNADAKVLFSSSRMVLGKILKNPVTEEHPTNPLTLYGIHKLTTEKYHLFYHRDYGIRTVVLRLTNPYGERQQIKHSKYSLPGWFMRCAMEGKEITIFGDGSQRRDYLYATDLADAILAALASDQTTGEVLNCGHGQSRTFREMVKAVVKAVGSGKITHTPWPKDYEQIETGDLTIDTGKLKAATGWSACVGLEEGVARMVAFYKKHAKAYLEGA